MAAPVLTPRQQDFPRWYQDVVAKAELAETGPVRGTMVIRPDGYAIWERMQAELDVRIKAAGARNAYFPMLIPESYFEREAEHVEGFSPELAVVTHAGGKALDAPAVLRPTSETVINAYFARWVQSWRDLPLVVNQWANVVRWELRPRLFLRTTEFLWQEGHTVHAGESDARAFALRILSDVYESVMVDVMAIPVLTGRKTERERFAGAVTTWTCEAMMGDGKALQMGTSHELGQGFARAFGIGYQSEEGEAKVPWQTSWGVSTRLVGGLIMAHGDDAGLRLPPAVAPVQVVVLVIRADDGAGEAAQRLTARLRDAGVRVELDARTEVSFGRRSTDWELKGVPLRLEVGPRELASGQAVLVRRHRRSKEPISLEGSVAAVTSALGQAQAELLSSALADREHRTVGATTADEAVEAAGEGFATIAWRDLGLDGEARLADAGVSVRCLQRSDGGLPSSEDADEDLVAVVGRSY